MISLLGLLAATAGFLTIRGFSSGSTKIDESLIFDARPEVVWCYVTEPKARVLWEPGLTNIVSLEAPDVAQITRWLLIMRSAGNSYEVEEDLVESEPNAVRRVQRLSDRYRSDVLFSLSQDRTQVRLSYSEKVVFVQPVDRIFAPFIGVSWSAKARDGLARLAEILAKTPDATSPC